MGNYTVTVQDNILTITIDITKDCGRANSDKSLRIATSNGNVDVEGTDLKLGLNLYRPDKKCAK